jgi:hypothetical protein
MKNTRGNLQNFEIFKGFARKGLHFEEEKN